MDLPRVKKRTDHVIYVTSHQYRKHNKQERHMVAPNGVNKRNRGGLGYALRTGRGFIEGSSQGSQGSGSQ
jgi:hypothetical protein